MCEFCIKHGEGKKWYEVMEHYSRELLSLENREEYIKNFFPNMQRTANSTLARLELAKRKVPLAYRFIRKIGTGRMKKLHFGQVVPLEDAEKIVDMVHSITRIPCVCRNVTTGQNSARYCLVLGIDPAGLFGDYPDLRASLETLTPAGARELLREFDRKGLVHSIWTFKTPYIGAICNCDRDCLAYRVQITNDLMNVMFKGEYFAVTDLTQCTGCRACRKLCQFGAIEFSVLNSKCYINTDKCFGCGVCRSACPANAIILTDRTAPYNTPL
ncbi:MAG TPA: 4Fe-4S binding protein [Desulfobacteria bacterium]|nr:4Fe-4S binding protein [Desulfobacteria bacterium]